MHITTPISLVILIHISQAVCGVEYHTPNCASEGSTGSKGRTFHFNDRTSFTLSICNLSPGFTEEPIS